MIWPFHLRFPRRSLLSTPNRPRRGAVWRGAAEQRVRDRLSRELPTRTRKDPAFALAEAGDPDGEEVLDEALPCADVAGGDTETVHAIVEQPVAKAVA